MTQTDDVHAGITLTPDIRSMVSRSSKLLVTKGIHQERTYCLLTCDDAVNASGLHSWIKAQAWLKAEQGIEK